MTRRRGRSVEAAPRPDGPAILGAGWRASAWDRLDQPWDVVVVGGGITGAGILRHATAMGLRALLVEQRDIAWGTSSRSSKLVHGGLRYLAQGDVPLVRAAVLEREHLLAAAPGLVDELGFVMPAYRGEGPDARMLGAALTAYDALGGRRGSRGHRRYRRDDVLLLAPHLAPDGLTGGFRYVDAWTDDARLTLRVVLEAVRAGGTVLTYSVAGELLRVGGDVVGVRVRDVAPGAAADTGAASPGAVADIRAAVVINATGAWADRLRAGVGGEPRIRPLRGSHLVVPATRLPAPQATSFWHPADGRPVFIIPWEGMTIVGTTDIDHEGDLDVEPAITRAEADYLFDGLRARVPSLGIGPDDVVATWAGVRPVVGSGKRDPSKETRDHVVWAESGLLTVTGGKLTTFRLIARDALAAVRCRLPGRPPLGPLPSFDESRDDAAAVATIATLTAGGAWGGTRRAALDPSAIRRLEGRYGAAAALVAAAAGPGELEPVPGTPALWVELRWAARAEGVVHLDDLLLRRVRLGLILRDGGMEHADRIRAICADELGWDRARWDEEAAAYRGLHARAYAAALVGGPGAVPAAPLAGGAGTALGGGEGDG